MDNTQPPLKKQKVEHNDAANEVHPAETLHQKAASWNCDVTSSEFAVKMDEEDPLRHFRQKFHYPKCVDLPEVDRSLVSEDEDCIYFCGNSLGLMPKSTPDCITRELDKWAKMGVQGHRNGLMPWAFSDEYLIKDMAKLVGARRDEVGLMNGLTVNLHLLLISFYEPTKSRHKIVLENKSFPSDHYAVESQIRLKGFDPETSMVCLKPREGEFTLRPEDILSYLEREGDSVAVVLLPGVQYYTGQLFDMKTITEVAQRKGCLVGYDLAHAVGNVPMYLHDWGVDFACWCTYKYLSSGPGGIAGAFIHDKHAHSQRFRLTGWWGHKMETRFNMKNVMELSPGIAGYRISNPPALLCAPLEASLKIYNETTMEDLRAKSKLLTAYLELLLKHYYPKPKTGTVDHDSPFVEIITPEDPAQRGSQLSAMFSVSVVEVFEALQRRGVVGRATAPTDNQTSALLGCSGHVLDHRKPNVLRLAPLPMYNSFADVHRFVKMLGDAMRDAKNHSQTNGAKRALGEATTYEEYAVILETTESQ